MKTLFRTDIPLTCSQDRRAKIKSVDRAKFSSKAVLPLRAISNGSTRPAKLYGQNKINKSCRLQVVNAAAESESQVNGLTELEDCIEAEQFSREMLDELFDIAEDMEKVERGTPDARMLEGYIMATLFYEPSTRTRLSFESAMRRLGGAVLTTESAGEYSSAAKGETLEDTMRTVEGYADVIVLRHFQAGSAKRAAGAASIPIINAGDGPGQHPTQALLDLYTIRKEVGRLDNIKVGLVGDLANGRTVRSLATALTLFDNVTLVFVAPPVVKMKDDIKHFLDENNVSWIEVDDLMKVASEVDVLYQTRIQRERFADRPEEYEQARGKYIITKEVMEALPETSVVMHPLPRLDEIAEEVDSDPRAAYFRQAQNGLYIRMALLKILLNI
mmetsp:Transcript_17483/g.20969  ORF Transcript_17483/g.20969 Transcript_17483/m.20969 type:complete len:387 (+) Transcript_17483:90-1250(+)|eukprot:CAMPEP_0197849374 /NCGR_PEP_ID=MMETSP1438-20131217/11816_1 /TAXON_ID=1461541 /ORGANISM="Pterosperma sp., Strain CCMP1384" /LENGTH=386 /DNA_ID=CAMNT_0043462033 /DNA_START=89 /DNA_END=1249 /DNA_ORIENTATION=+